MSLLFVGFSNTITSICFFYAFHFILGDMFVLKGSRQVHVHDIMENVISDDNTNQITKVCNTIRMVAREYRFLFLNNVFTYPHTAVTIILIFILNFYLDFLYLYYYFS